jgi:hypothetical protein
VNDDRLTGLLAALRAERMERTADQKLRARLENAWTAREDRSGLAWRLRRPVLTIATTALIFGLAATTLSAPGDSPLYSLRVTIEDLAIPLHRDPEDRAEYLVSLLEQRTSEAARLEATGNALAASRARDIERQTLRMVQQNIPVAPDAVDAAPTDSPSPSPTPSPAASPTPSPTEAPRVVVTQSPATARPTTAPPATATPTPRPSTAATPQAVTFTGAVKNPDGTYATNVCVSFNAAGPCQVVTTSATFRVTFSGKIGQSVTLYFLRTDGIKTYKAYITKTISSTYVDVGIVLLRVQ